MEASILPLSNLCTQILSRTQQHPSRSSSSSSSPQLNPHAPLSSIRSDFITLCQSIGKECTSFSLACKPPASVDAVEGVVKNLANLVGKLDVCLGATVVVVEEEVSALAREINWTGQEMIESLQRLLDSSLATYLETDVSKAKSGRELTLRLTGQVWEKVQRATEISRNELQATRKDWKSVLGLLDDCLVEVKEMEEAISEQDEEEEEDEDEEDDFRHSHPLTPLELSRVSASYMILRLSRLLLNRLINSTSPPNPLPQYSTPSFLSHSQKLVKQLSEKADDFAGALEPPQDREKVEEQVEEFVQVGRELSRAVEEAVRIEVSKTAEEEASKVEREKEAKWQLMWRDQLDKALEKMISLKD